MKKVLITGAKGFIGRHALASLKECNFDIHATTSEPLNNIENDLFKKATWYQVNLFNYSEIKEIFAQIKPTHLLHFAWNTTHQEYWNSELNFQWVQASLEMLRQFHHQGGKRVVIAGTCAEYDWNYGYCSELLTPRNPHSIYGICKQSLQEMFTAFCKQYNISGAWGRIFWVYGPYENPKRLIPYVTCSLLKNEFALCSSGDQIRDFLYVEDAANAFVELLNSDVIGAINISSGQPVQIKEIIQKIAKITNKPEFVRLGAISGDHQSQDSKILVANINRLVSELSWQQKFDLDSGLDLTVNWWRNNLK